MEDGGLLRLPQPTGPAPELGILARSLWLCLLPMGRFLGSVLEGWASSRGPHVAECCPGLCVVSCGLSQCAHLAASVFVTIILLGPFGRVRRVVLETVFVSILWTL